MAEVDHTHLVFLDDSGTKGYREDAVYNTDGGESAYFTYAGPFGARAGIQALASRIAQIKQECFGTTQVELKSSWLRRPEHRRKRYEDKFDVTEDDLTECVDAVYDALQESPVKLVACVVNKAEMQKLYGDGAWYPATISYEFLMQRVMMHVSRVLNAGVRVVVDDMDGATPAGNQYKANLRKHHATLARSGSRLQKSISFRALKDLRFKDSAKNHLLQLADLVAYNTMRQFRDHGDDWFSGGESIQTYRHFGRIAGSFLKKPGTNRVAGYGCVVAPKTGPATWGVR